MGNGDDDLVEERVADAEVTTWWSEQRNLLAL